MKSHLLAAKVPKQPNKLVDVAFDTTYIDSVGGMTAAPYGYPNNLPVIEQVDGRGALRVKVSQGILYTVAPGKPRLMATADWRVEWEARMVNPTLFKHESMIAFRKATALTQYTFHIWKRAQTANKIIIAGDLWKDENAPMFTDATAMTANTWRRFAIQHTAVDNTTRFYSDGVLRGSRVSNSDVSSDLLDILGQPAPNNFDGWIRNLKVFNKAM